MRGRRLITAFMVTGLLAVVATGCGGDDVAPEVPGPPADVVIPESADAPAAATSQDESTTDQSGDGSTDSGSTDDSGTTTPEETAPSTDQGTTTPDSAGGGTAAPEADADGPTNDTPPPEGSNAEQFEDFCAQNPGAC